MSSIPKFEAAPLQHLLEGESLPIVVVSVPMRFPQKRITGFATKVRADRNDIWMVIAPPDSSEACIASLLAVLMIDDKEPLLTVGSMPARPPVACRLTSGDFRQARGKRLAPWAIEEIARVADVLRANHSEYVLDLLRALNGAENAFATIPPGFAFRDDRGEMRVGPPPPEIKVNLSQSERVLWGLAWHQVASADYSRNRYMADLTQDQLSRRIEDIFANLHIIDDHARVSFDLADPLNHYWMLKLQEAATEMRLRHGPYPAGWSSDMIRRNSLPASLDMKHLGRNVRLSTSRKPGEILVKFGQKVFLELALNRGIIRLGAASMYNDSSLNPAVRDDELAREIDFDPYFLGIGLDARLDGLNFPNSRRTVKQALNSDYYVYCLATRLTNRLLLDFEADAALVIHQPNEFLRRLDSAVRDQLPKWSCVAEHVSYYDPLQVTPVEVSVITWKHFRYAYQREYRVAWVPPRVCEKLSEMFVELGPLGDIAELCVPEPIRGA